MQTEAKLFSDAPKLPLISNAGLSPKIKKSFFLLSV